ncbi:MAG: NTP transferase domain-containing protein [Nitrospira sp.]|nr:NTP transferase domain-containing protein [Nitrospira sp.]
MSKSNDKLLGVILAAGKGTRIYPFSQSLPKPILPVSNKPLLEHQIEIMKSYGINEIIIVIGYMGYTIVNALGDGSRMGVTLKYVDQSETLGIAHALGKLEPYIDSPFLLLLGDIYFAIEEISFMVDAVLSGEANAYLVSKIEKDPEMIKRNFAIIEGEGNRVRQVIEKPRYVRNHIKGCGLYLFDQHIFDAIRRTPRTAMRDEYEITESIQIMINDGYSVYHSPAVNKDMNLTVPEDLLLINLMDLHRHGLPNLIGNGVKMHSGTIIENSVIGDNVVIEHPITLRDSLVFKDSVIKSKSNINRAIIHEDNTIPC